MEQRITLKDYAMRFGQTKTAKDLGVYTQRNPQQQRISGQMNNYQNLANIGLGALQGQANAGQTYANNMSQISQQSAALAAANANRPSAMQSAIGGGASGAIPRDRKPTVNSLLTTRTG